MAMTDPTKTSTPETASTRPDVTTDRSNVVSEPTRETKSPVRRVSYSRTDSRNMRYTKPRRVSRTTASAVRCSRYCWKPLMTAEMITIATSSATTPPSGCCACTDAMTTPTIAGCAMANAAPTIEMPVTASSTPRCGRRYGQSWRSFARGCSVRSSVFGAGSAVAISSVAGGGVGVSSLSFGGRRSWSAGWVPAGA
jgi:hypothetical protein